MNKYTIESLKTINESYDYEHRVTQQDVNRVNQLVELIESTRSKNKPQIGDVVEFTNSYGDYYNHAHIESIEDDMLYICEQPYTPFVEKNRSKNTFSTSTSGGAWSHIPKNLTYVGTRQKLFKVWGHNGACGNGGVSFYAEVSVWTYTEGNPQFTTKTHDKFHVTIREDADEHGYKYIVKKGAITSHAAFQTKEEYEAWLKTFKGVEVEGQWKNNKIVWTLRQESKCIPLEEYEEVQNAVIDSELCNGSIQECKRLYKGTTVKTIMPYQSDKIELENTKRYMRAYAG
ncbi:DUF4121 family protein (plasmid) [Aneurinibacillus sp. Ricciae_BoGa-3]|uniref:DUF4121 family protein n=1 Tax=Aneurinibacillus sp. Ricciae_BoGa-3 TaxID=3022697 RepID=UPI0023417578|nr:DUF4121 family protein [Aneurinibacillus sp. Ricciae_BoGa-3]WCK57353.1 DUF4121 family protein [Aneurinibacillus sp. Ricciae_BoGa-3]